jgi:carboxylesterase type B
LLIVSYVRAFTYGASNTFVGPELVRQSVADQQPVIHVSLNLLIDIFGSVTFSFAAENGAANLGLQDAMLGLQWIKDHIWVDTHCH